MAATEEHWLDTGLLLSSFSDGLKPNEQATNFLINGLVRTLWREHLSKIERQVEESVLASPCCGPTDLESLTKMETADTALTEKEEKISWKESLKQLQNESEAELELRFLYIPTAMYALRSDSKNTPGKQRQRARADGKKRRNEIIELLTNQLGDCVNILAVTLDFDDGSIKQPQGGTDQTSRYPTNGKEALESWKPHLIYIQGGNTFWLYHCIEKGGYKELLINAVTGNDAAVYCGTSAGAIIAGSSMETATWKGWDDPSVVPNKPNYNDWKGVSGLNLAGDISIFPHMDSQWQALVDEKQQEIAGQVYCLKDEEILKVDGNTKTVEKLVTSCASAA